MLKSWVRGAFRRFGYQVFKYPQARFAVAPVFDLSVQVLMAVRGRSLKFIQVGANDGRYNDPLNKYISKYDWRGILVEPQPDVFARLCANYAAAKDRLIFENVAVGAGGGSIAMYKAADGGATRSGDAIYDASVVSADRKVVAGQLGLKPEDLKEFMVPCVTLDELVERHGFSNFDLLQIDAEGHDFSVLKTLNLSQTQPAIIQFEHGHLSPREVSDVVSHLDRHGYRTLYGGEQIDSVALHKDFLSSID